MLVYSTKIALHAHLEAASYKGPAPGPVEQEHVPPPLTVVR
jgi:hypothetical protein